MGAAFQVMTFQSLSRDSAMELAVGKVILKPVDRVVEVSKGVIDGDNIHFARHEGSLGSQAHNTAKCMSPTFTIGVSGTRLPRQKMHLSLEWG